MLVNLHNLVALSTITYINVDRQVLNEILKTVYHILCYEVVLIKCSQFLSTGFRAEIAERRSYIEAIYRNIKKLEEEIRVKQSTLIHNKANAKRYDN